MNRSLRIWTLLLITGSNSLAFSQNNSENEVPEILFDMRYKTGRTIEYSAISNEITVRFVNMIPSQRVDYILNVTQAYDSEPPLSNNGTGILKPSNVPAVPAFGARFVPEDCDEGDVACKERVKVCTEIMEDTNDLAGAQTEDVVASKIASLLRNIRNSNAAACQNEVSAALSMIETTKSEYVVATSPGATIMLQVRKAGHEYSFTKFKPYKTKWVTHLGFTFVKNQGDSFYSENTSVDLGAANYTISPQNNEHDYLYSATGLWTYRLHQWNNGIQFGLTAGLGANNQSIMIVVGPSLIFGDNFLFNVGVIAQEFDQLKGTYREGQELGAVSVDSSNLVEKTFEFSYGFTFGFKFGG